MDRCGGFIVVLCKGGSRAMRCGGGCNEILILCHFYQQRTDPGNENRKGRNEIQELSKVQ